MKILVTGLCLSRNLGGPAMALSLMAGINARLNETPEYVFAVDRFSLEEESQWADYYGVDVVPRDNLVEYFGATNQAGRILRTCYRKLSGIGISEPGRNHFVSDQAERLAAKSVHRKFMEAIQSADVIVDMNGISYIGDGTRGWREGPVCYSNYYYCKSLGKPFARFVQSFGPFDSPLVKYFAGRELNNLPFVPARGKVSKDQCSLVVNDKSKLYSFPDIAIKLTSDRQWASDYLAKNMVSDESYICVSPSAVIANDIGASTSTSVGEQHVASLEKICRGLLSKGENIVLLPHMYSRVEKDSDRAVALEIADRLGSDRVYVVEDDIDPRQAKGVIAGAKLAIVSRYHALVAALSTGVRAIAIGWNVKYQDIMEYYGQENWSYDARIYSTDELAKRVLGAVEELGSIDEVEWRDQFTSKHNVSLNCVEESFDLLVGWLQDG